MSSDQNENGKPVWTESPVEPLERGPKKLQSRQSPFSVLSDLFSELVRLLTHPTQYFNEHKADDWTRALSWGVFVHWIGAILSFLWTKLLFPNQMQEALKSYSELSGWDSGGIDLGMAANVMEAAMVVADPFLTVIGAILTGLLVWVGARLMVDPQAQFGDAIKVVSYGLVAAAFQVVPYVGGFAAWAYGLALSVIAAKVIFNQETFRAILIVVFPKIVSFGLTLVLAILIAIPVVLAFGASV